MSDSKDKEDGNKKEISQRIKKMKLSIDIKDKSFFDDWSFNKDEIEQVVESETDTKEYLVQG